MSGVLAACSFEPGSYATHPDSGGTGGGSDEADPTPLDGATVARTCQFPDQDLRLCIEFEDRTYAPTVSDASAARLDAPSTSVDETRRLTGYAAGMTLGSRIDVPEAMGLDITSAVTIEMWIWPVWPHSANLLVNANQYGVQMAGDGRIGCLFPSAAVWSTATVKPQQWTHIACTYAAGAVRVFVNGVVKTVDQTAALTGAGMEGTRIGNGYGGGIDDIRVYARALGLADVCTHAGRVTCVSPAGSPGE